MHEKDTNAQIELGQVFRLAELPGSQAVCMQLLRIE
jgi:hypothetical protein